MQFRGRAARLSVPNGDGALAVHQRRPRPERRHLVAALVAAQDSYQRKNTSGCEGGMFLPWAPRARVGRYIISVRLAQSMQVSACDGKILP